MTTDMMPSSIMFSPCTASSSFDSIRGKRGGDAKTDVQSPVSDKGGVREEYPLDELHYMP